MDGEGRAYFFRGLLEKEKSPDARNMLYRLIAEAESEECGVCNVCSLKQNPCLPGRGNRAFARKHFQREFESTPLACLLIDPRPGLRIIDQNDAFDRATGMSAKKAVGERVFVAYPDNPNDIASDGVSNVFKSMQIAAKTQRPYSSFTRYDACGADGIWRRHYWQYTDIPVIDRGLVLYILHYVAEVSAPCCTPHDPAAPLASFVNDKCWWFVDTDPLLAHVDRLLLERRLRWHLKALEDKGERNPMTLASTAIYRLRSEMAA